MLSIVRSIKSDTQIGVAVSGGVDSMVALHHLRKTYKDKIFALHLRHNESDTAEEECKFVMEQCDLMKIPLYVKLQKEHREAGQSKEEYWRKARYELFTEFSCPIATGHTLDDAVEWYLFSCFHGMGKFMEYSHANVIRPFLTTKKSKIVEYARQYNVAYMEDETNFDPNFAARNRIRNLILPEVLKVNPGIHKVVKKRILEKMSAK